ncbi:hypothetical protein Cob_v001586 [Colletotrichum orbiculare MAFF 240422]|uniref:Uncharacterized protein n=1 Tax=Colletotrichum orbiculare (strain 104-T / ATCC 96160 / CBS 514.97 / LARS 414 / MAFF 240422) TaxID=1213857 RepID=A0A484G446_COLOR|nr:hypothetical protein Cob_v001586 [Colletotrichum orbiculare MAFF 240422]
MLASPSVEPSDTSATSPVSAPRVASSYGAFLQRLPIFFSVSNPRFSLIQLAQVCPSGTPFPVVGLSLALKRGDPL